MSKRNDVRALGKLVRCGLDPSRPLMANLIVTRRCNLRCGYCSEFDQVSPPVSTERLSERIDQLARLRVAFVTLTGGEPLLHPELSALVQRTRAQGMLPAMNTNGYLLTAEKIRMLNASGLYALQLSVDNLVPNAVSRKSLSLLRPKLELLAESAAFRVRVNAVLSPTAPREAVQVARESLEFGFDAKCSLVRDEHGRLVPLTGEARAAYFAIRQLGRRSSAVLSEDSFTDELVAGGCVRWKCRAGARYFHVCERGLVHYCSSRHGEPGTPLAQYSRADISRAFAEHKPCAATCTQAYAHQGSRMDTWRTQAL